MRAAFQKVRGSPLLVRVLPFAVFVILTALQSQLGAHSEYWLYVLKILFGVWAVWSIRPFIPEMRWSISWEGVVVGVGVFGVWVGLNPFYPSAEEILQNYLCPLLRRLNLQSLCPKASEPRSTWNPLASFPADPALAWSLVAVRVLGSTFVVPPLEEVFYRSFLYRYIVRPDFEHVPLNRFRPGPFLISGLIFGFAHFEWLAGILCAFAYHALILRKNRLDDAIVAHAITNFLLGLWVVLKGEWHFW